MKVIVTVAVVLVFHFELILADSCPTQMVLKCESIFNKTFKTTDLCRSTKMLESCLVPYADSCSENEEYLKASHLVERHSFLYCRCPEAMIEKFMTAFIASDMCSNLEVFEEFSTFFDVPACSNNKKYAVVKYMRKVLPGICKAQE